MRCHCPSVSFAFLSTFLQLFSPMADAAANQWTGIGPVGGKHVLSLAINPKNTSVLYAGTSDGVFKSIDGGASWNPANGGPIHLYAKTLVIDPSNPSVLYVSGFSGVNKSTDGGQNWVQSSTGLPSSTLSLGALVIDPKNTSTIYVGSDFRDGVFKSENGGLSWNPVNNGLQDSISKDYFVAARALAIDPSNSSTVYLGTSLSGVYKSTNGGASWNAAVYSIIGSFYLVEVLAIDPPNPATLYLGTYSQGVYKSTDGGSSWKPANTGIESAHVTALVIDPANSATLYVGTKTNDAVGVFKSTDGGLSWTPFNAGLTSTDVTSLAIDPSNPTTLYAGTDGGGVFKYAANQTPPEANAECLFTWAEKNYPNLFSPSGVSTAVSGVYYYRSYSGTNAVLRASSADGHVYYQGPDGQSQDVGPLSDWLPKASCKVSAPPAVECLFNWAEKNYPSLFAPSGSATALSNVYAYRYYSANNAYLGVSSADNHVYYLESDGKLQDEGPTSHWLPLAGCQ